MPAGTLGFMTNPDAPQTAQHLQGAVTTTKQDESPLAAHIRLRAQAVEVYTLLAEMQSTLLALGANPFGGLLPHVTSMGEDSYQLKDMLAWEINKLGQHARTEPEPPGNA